MADGRPVTDYENDGIAKLQAEYRQAGENGDKVYIDWLAKQDWSKVELAEQRHKEWRAEAAKTYVARKDSNSAGGWA